MNTTLSYLPSLLAGLSGASSSLLDTVYGRSNATSTGQNAIQSLATAEKYQTQEVARTGQEPAVERAVASFTQTVKSATSVAELLANKQAMDVLLTANGLGDQKDYTALAKAVLTSDLNDPDSLANRLSDTRWKALARTYDFAAKGLSSIQSSTAITAIAKGYAQTVWEQRLNEATPGLANAMTFKTIASSVTNVDQILGDPTLRTVVTTTLGIPKQIAFQSLSAQEKAITDRLDISKLQDSRFVENFAKRYLMANAQADTANSSTETGVTAVALHAGGILI
ncbi:MAG: DUF1217 domain-containing protein [Proteobacteria bacterium]|nr:DUF1217 domain-containing protein [Pseudomonadota bacterium]